MDTKVFDPGRDEGVIRHAELGGPKELGARIFPDDITSCKDLFSQERRDRVRRVVLYRPFETVGLSYPIIYGSMLAQYLPKNFQNADFVDFTGLMQLVDAGQRKVVTPEEGLAAWSQGAKDPDSSVMFFTSQKNPGVRQPYCERASDLTVSLKNFGTTNDGTFLLYRRTGKTIQDRILGSDRSIQSIQDYQARLMKYLGFSDTPIVGEHNSLPETQYSEILRQRISGLEAEYQPILDGRPLVVINALKKNPVHKAGNELEAVLKPVLQENDAVFIVNKGRRTGLSTGIWARGEALEKRLKEIAPEKVHDPGPMDLVHLAAMTHIADKSGGLSLNVFGGPTLLCDWLGKREIVLDNQNWDHLIREHPRQTKVLLPFEIPKTVKDALDQNRK
ncbi:hypothetical protein ACFLRF_02010 [Candidatus Altiarchaeota archaeon]